MKLKPSNVFLLAVVIVILCVLGQGVKQSVGEPLEPPRKPVRRATPTPTPFPTPPPTPTPPAWTPPPTRNLQAYELTGVWEEEFQATGHYYYRLDSSWSADAMSVRAMTNVEHQSFSSATIYGRLLRFTLNYGNDSFEYELTTSDPNETNPYLLQGTAKKNDGVVISVVWRRVTGIMTNYIGDWMEYWNGVVGSDRYRVTGSSGTGANVDRFAGVGEQTVKSCYVDSEGIHFFLEMSQNGWWRYNLRWTSENSLEGTAEGTNGVNPVNTAQVLWKRMVP